MTIDYLILGFIILSQSVCICWFSYVFITHIFSESGVPKYKDPPKPPKKKKCVGIVMGRRLYRDENS